METCKVVEVNMTSVDESAWVAEDSADVET